MTKYAEGTIVPAVKSRLEIERMVLKYAGEGAEFAYVQKEDQADIVFAAHGRRVRFTLPLPTMEEAKKGAMRKNSCWQVTEVAPRRAWVEKETMRRWRCLLLAIKAKLEVVESGIASFEEEFLAHVVNPAGVTVYQAIKNAENGSRLLPPI